MRKQYLLLLALAISFVAFGVIAPIKASFNNVILNQACLAPENIAHTSLDGVSATLTWDYNGVGDSFEVFYGEDATVDEDDMVATETTSVDEVSLANLTPATTYYLWVRAECELADDDDETIVVYSAWEGPYTFTTPPVNDECAGAIVLTVNDSDVCVTSTTATFNGATLGDTQIYYCSQDIEGDVWFEFEAISSEHVVTLSGLSSVSGIGFNIYNTTDSACATGMGETCVMGGSSFTFEDLVVGDTYQVHVYTLTQDFTEEFQICITTNCPQPTEVSLVNGQLTWEYPEGVEATFEYIVSENPVPPTVTTPATGTTTDNFVTIEELNEHIDMEASTQYHFWVRAICDFNEDLQNEWSDTFYFFVPPANDNCEDATTALVNEGSMCDDELWNEGTLLGATPIEYDEDGGQIPNGNFCTSTMVGDVWYEFTATSDRHSISFTGFNTTYNVFVAVYEGDVCGTGQPSIACASVTNIMNLEDLVIGQNYKIRVFTTSLTAATDFLMCITAEHDPIYVSTTDYTVPELVTEVLIGEAGDCAEVSNISWRTGTDFGKANGIGYFENDDPDFPMESGIILATGNVMQAPGPANNTTWDTGGNQWPGDDDLKAYMNATLGNNDNYNDATVLEFDFRPMTDSLSFNFIFGSNEYGTFQCGYSDAFAFFLTDLATGVVTNLALVPNTTDPISVTTIRDCQYYNGSTCSDGGPCSQNEEYFHSFYGTPNGFPTNIAPVNLKGHTVLMTATSEVTPGGLYHIKLVIADRGPGPTSSDSIMDSAVFLEARSFDLGSIDLGDDMLIENENAICEEEEVVLDTQLDPEQYTFEWYKDNELIEGAEDPSYVVTESGEYRVEASYGGIEGCSTVGSILVEIYLRIVLDEDLQNIDVCVIPDRMPEVDITIHESVFDPFKLAGADFEYSYHLSENEALDDLNAIANPEAYVPTQIPVTIYIRVYNTLTECVQVFDFDIIRRPIINFTPHNDIPICVYPDYFTTTNLTQVEPFFTDQTLTSLVFSGYYLDQTDAYSLTNAITNTTDFLVEELPTTIYMAILNEETGCYSFTSFNIVATETLDPMTIEDIVICDGYLVPELPAGQYYSTQEFGQGDIIQPGRVLGMGNHVMYINVENEIGCVFSHRYEIHVTEC